MASGNAKSFPYGFPNQIGVSGTTNAGPLLQDVPTVAADLVAKDTYLFQVQVTNGTGAAISLTMTDKQSPAKNVFDATSIPANTTVAFNWEEGLFCSGGLTWVAGAVGLDGSVVAFYRN